MTELIFPIVAGLAIGLLLYDVRRLKRKVRDIEARDWPQRVVEWRTLESYNCRCTLEKTP